MELKIRLTLSFELHPEAFSISNQPLDKELTTKDSEAESMSIDILRLLQCHLSIESPSYVRRFNGS